MYDICINILYSQLSPSHELQVLRILQLSRFDFPRSDMALLPVAPETLAVRPRVEFSGWIYRHSKIMSQQTSWSCFAMCYHA